MHIIPGTATNPAIAVLASPARPSTRANQSRGTKACTARTNQEAKDHRLPDGSEIPNRVRPRRLPPYRRRVRMPSRSQSRRRCCACALPQGPCKSTDAISRSTGPRAETTTKRATLQTYARVRCEGAGTEFRAKVSSFTKHLWVVSPLEASKPRCEIENSGIFLAANADPVGIPILIAFDPPTR